MIHYFGRNYINTFARDLQWSRTKNKKEAKPEGLAKGVAMQEFLKAEGLTKTFTLSPFKRKGDKDKTVVALQDVSLTVNKGEIMGIIGPNGAGKSTFIKIVAGLVMPDKGEVTLDGKSIKSDRNGYLSSLGAQIESPAFYEKRSGLWNLRYLAQLQGGLAEERINDIVRTVGLESRIKSSVSTYSMGMKQRLAIAQAIMHNPSFLILDEPINGLDPDGIVQIRQLIRDIRDNYGTTVLLSSHILNEMQLLCDRVAFLSRGKITAVMTMEQIEKGADSTHILAVECDEPNRSAELIQKEFSFRTKVIGKDLYVEMKEGDAAKINKLLIENGVSVTGFSVRKRSLEEIYREMTK